MQNSKTNKKIHYMLNRRINSTIKLDKLINHQERIQRIKQNVKSSEKQSNQNQSNYQKVILPQIFLNSNKSTLKISQPMNNVQADQTMRVRNHRMNSQKQEQLLSQPRQRLMTSINQSKQESKTQAILRMYLKNLLLHKYQNSIEIRQQISRQMKQIKCVWWNLVITIIQNVIKHIKNVHFCHHLARAYFHLDEEITENEDGLLKIFEDQHHQSLISEVFYFEKVLLLIAITLQQQLTDKIVFKWLTDSLRYIIQIKHLLTNILLENEEHFSKFNKIKKPSYLIRQKKLIQINRIITQIKESFNRIAQIYPGKLHNFAFQALSSVGDRRLKISQLLKQLLHIPQKPFIQFTNPKPYMIVINPEHMMYSEDKKNACITLKPFAEDYIDKLSAYCQIVLFFHKKINDMHPFLQSIDQAKIAKALDSSYYTYKQTKKNIDLKYFGYNATNIIVIDSNPQKWCHRGKQHLIVHSSQAKSQQTVQMFQKILSLLKEKMSAKEIAHSFKIHS